MYLILRQFRVSRWVALVGGFFINLDMMNVIESRLILTDSQLMFYSALALYVALKFWARLNALAATSATATAAGTSKKRSQGGFRMSTKEENAWCIGLGLACGAALRFVIYPPIPCLLICCSLLTVYPHAAVPFIVPV